MKKAMLIIILSTMLTACGTTENTVKEEPTAVTSAVSQTTTTAAETTSKTEKSSKAVTTTTVTTAKATSTSKTTTTTTKAETTASKSTTRKTVSETTTTQQPIQKTETQTYIVYYNEPSPETQQTQPEVRVTEAKPITTTTVQTIPPTTTTTTTAPTSGIEWSDSMKVWRKLCEGKKLSGSEQDIIRNEILDYAVSSFNGKKDVHVSFGIDSNDISYEKPLNLTIDYGMTSMANAHMDAYVDANRKGMIDYASSEDEIYSIVCETREKCLHVIDYGLFNRWEIFTINNSLKYASDIEFNVGFDEEMTIWFLTQD